jgi:AbrB family looped-hinge helix DNA binding protein
MSYSTLSSKGQLTIPKQLREKLDLSAGDKIEFKVENNVIKLRKINLFDEAYHKATEGTLSEWMSEEDNEAYRDL